MTTMTKTERETLEMVRIDDWKDIGDLYEGPMNEDGERPIRRPKSDIVLVAITKFGRMYVKSVNGLSPEERETMRTWVERVGSVNPDKWFYVRGVYGSDAYQADGWEAYDIALDR